jgi:hypothetical protein
MEAVPHRNRLVFFIRRIHMRKRFLITVIVLLVLSTMVFTGCTRKLIWMENSGKDHIRASYKLFSGTEKKGIRVDQGDTLVIDFESEVGKGALTLTIEDPEGNSVFSMESGEEGSGKIVIDQTGKYALVIDGDETSGSFDINWSIE